MFVLGFARRKRAVAVLISDFATDGQQMAITRPWKQMSFLNHSPERKNKCFLVLKLVFLDNDDILNIVLPAHED